MLLLSWDLKPVKFHRYTSSVRERVFESEFTKEIEYLRSQLLEAFNYHGIKCHDDNKIVFECSLHGKTVCFGFYDLKFSIGFSYWNENEKKK